jgi:hypothetical protein
MFLRSCCAGGKEICAGMVLPPSNEVNVSRQQSLSEECLAAFENYAREARRTCQLLGEAEVTAPSGEQLLAILSQAQIESDLRELYASLRQRLCKALASGVEVSGAGLETPFLEIDADQRVRRN